MLGQNLVRKSTSRDPDATRPTATFVNILEPVAYTTLNFSNLTMHFSPGVLATCIALLLPPLVGGAATNTTRTTVTPGNSHSLTESYQFDPRDGWESVIVTNLRYKYRRSSTPFLGMPSATPSGKNSSSALKRPPSTNTQHSSTKNVFRSVGESLAEFTKGIIAIGKPEDVIITWFDTFVRQRYCV